jgi:LysM repeat protein
MFLLTNRFAVHATIVMVVASTVVLNIQTTQVRAETFGERSLLYELVAQEGIEIIEEMALDIEGIEVSSVSYREPAALSSFARGIDFLPVEDVSVSLIGGGGLSAPTISDGAESVAPREGVEVYVAQSGDTLSSIASQFGISLNTLLWANDLSVRSILKPGAELAILPTSGVKHAVKSGDTLSSIAKKYSVEESEIVKYNKLASANDLVVGESLIVPDGTIAAPVRTTPSVTSVFTPSIPTTTSSADPATSGSGVMVWPTDLHTITQYYGWRHTGLDVDCKFTNDNYAADDGIVQFAGWKSGYGYTVEINHGNGIMTRYGHHASMYVTAGEQVAKGQAIGRCGTTGRSTGTHLHFEVISGGRFKNPLDYIR